MWELPQPHRCHDNTVRALHVRISSCITTICLKQALFEQTRLLLVCPKRATERHKRYFGDSIDITDVFQDSDNLVEFLISSGHLPPSPTWACHDDDDDNNNNNNKL